MNRQKVCALGMALGVVAFTQMTTEVQSWSDRYGPAFGGRASTIPIAMAADCQFTLTDTWAKLEVGGSKIVALLDVPGVWFDQVLIYIKDDTLKIGPVLEGCMVGPPLPIADMQKGTTTVKRPALGV